MTFADFARAHGLQLKNPQIGRIARCPTESKPHKENASYLYMGSWGWLQDHGIHDEIQVWQDKNVSPEIIKKEMKLSLDNYAVERTKKAKEAARKASWILSQCELDKHAYLDSKGFPDLFGNIWRREGQDPLLCIPMMRNRELCGLQLISIDGAKKFLTGQKSSESYFRIGRGKKLFFCEGYATGLSVQAVLSVLKVDYSIIVGFSAHNLIRLAYDSGGFVIADNDKSGTGEEAAKKTGLPFYMPSVVGEDFNDEWKRLGTFKTSQLLRKFIISV